MPCFLNGKFYPGVTRHLCKMHYTKVWEVMLETLRARVQVNEAYEKSQDGRDAA